MSKNKPTTLVPMTSVVTITTDGCGGTVARMAAEQETATAACRPGDTYSEYEGARIALARLYGVDPFPKVENVGEEKGHWARVTRENCQKGARVRVVAEENSDGAYENGDQGVLQDTYSSGSCLLHILFDGHKTVACPGCWPRELEVWIPDAPEEAKPQEAPIPEAPKTFTPSFQVENAGGNVGEEKGHWAKATKENCKEGSRVRVTRAVQSFGRYKDGDTGVVDSLYFTDMASVKFDGKSKVTQPACFLDELEVWIPDDQPPSEAQPEAQKPFTPSFQVGDIVRLEEDASIFHPSCQGKIGKVIEAYPFSSTDVCYYRLRVIPGPGEERIQLCTEFPNYPVPLELVYRHPRKDGEKAR